MWFNTLTCVVGELRWKAHEKARRRFMDRVRRRWGNQVAIAWGREPHPKSGYPHLHLLWYWLVDPPDIEAFRQWMASAWAKSVGQSVEKVQRRHMDPKHLSVVANDEAAERYTAWYVGKRSGPDDVASEDEVGRSWGFYNKKLLVGGVIEAVASPVVGAPVLRTLRRRMERQRAKVQLWTLVSGWDEPKRYEWRTVTAAMIAKYLGCSVENVPCSAVLRAEALKELFSARFIRVKKWRACRKRIVSELLQRSEFLGEGKLGEREWKYLERGQYRVEDVCSSVFFVQNATFWRLVKLFEVQSS
jgi:hypothetical protein